MPVTLLSACLHAGAVTLSYACCAEQFNCFGCAENWEALQLHGMQSLPVAQMQPSAGFEL
jgi:hypothetical protein